MRRDYNDGGALGACFVMLLVIWPVLLIFYLVAFGPARDPNNAPTPYLERGG